MTDRRPIERPGTDSDVSADAWVEPESGMLLVSLEDVLRRPEGARGPEALLVELGASAPLGSAASALGCGEDVLLDLVVQHWDGRGADLLSWVRHLPGAEAWSGPRPWRPSDAGPSS